MRPGDGGWSWLVVLSSDLVEPRLDAGSHRLRGLPSRDKGSGLCGWPSRNRGGGGGVIYGSARIGDAGRSFICRLDVGSESASDRSHLVVATFPETSHGFRPLWLTRLQIPSPS